MLLAGRSVGVRTSLLFDYIAQKFEEHITCRWLFVFTNMCMYIYLSCKPWVFCEALFDWLRLDFLLEGPIEIGVGLLQYLHY
jgi:hypothetical protein